MRYHHRHYQPTYRYLCRVLCIVLMLGLLPLAAFAGGKKYFKEGLKYEATKEWDKAAEYFSLALREEPANPEFELHFLKSVSNASLMFMDRGRRLVDQKDYEGAYLAYKQAYSFDPTNEQAVAKMKEMLLKQGIPTTSKGEPDPYQQTAAKNKETAESTHKKRSLKNYDIPSDTIENIIRLIARQDLHFNVIFDQQSRSIVQTKIKFDMKEIPAAQALEILLDSNNLTFYPAAHRTILIGPRNNPTLAQKYDENLVQHFYIRNAKLQEVQNIITQMLGAGKQVAQNTQLNTLTVRDSPENLKIIQKLIAGIDKPQAEVVMDVNIYEITQDDMLQIGNQFLTSSSDPSKPQASLGILGGLGQSGLRSSAVAGLYGPLGASIIVPPSTLSFLQSRGNTRVLAQTQLHSFEGEEASVNIGRQVPIQTASIPTLNQPTTTTGGITQPQQSSTLFGGINQVQYKDVGLNITIKPKVIDDLIQMNLSIESSNVVAAAAATLTPTFTQRKVKGVARVRDGQTTIAASVMQQDDRNSKSGIPFLSLLPGIGSLFTTPQRSKQATHIIITVTPHILRGGAVSEEEEHATFGPLEYIIGPNGAASYGRQLDLQELVDLADEKDQQEAAVPVAETTVPTQHHGTSFVPTKAGNSAYGTTPAGQGDGIVRSSNPTPVPQANGNPSSLGRGNPGGVAPGMVAIPSTSTTPDSPGNTTPPANTGGGTSGNSQGTANQPPPIPMVVVVRPTIRPPVGQIITVAAIVNDSTNISQASFYLHYNPAVLKVVSIRDGGLLQPGTFDQRDDGGQVFARVTVSPSAGSVRATGQIALVDFQVIAPGQADLKMDVVEIRGSEQQLIPVALNSIPPVIVPGPTPQQE